MYPVSLDDLQLTLYSLAHPGAWAMQKLLTTRYVWTNINKDVCHLTWSCL